MKRTLLIKAMTFSSILLLAVAMQSQTTSDDATPAAKGNSKVRIVRLSEVKGVVDIDRHIGRGFENAIANLPIVEQTQLRTGVGAAEVEFEDNSSLRITPNSLIEFPSLERSASGATVSSVRLVKGTAYISLVKPQSKNAPENQFTLMFGSRTIDLNPATHVRVDLEGTEAKLAVMDGVVHVANGNGTVEIAKKKTATFQIFDQNEPTVAKDIEKSPFDEWDQTSSKYHSNVSARSAFSSPYAYGVNDMLYYGSFMDAGGCGSMWRPYFASATWDPYSNGTWAWYSGAGYSWVSPYPWAWTPYHYGSWNYCPGTGWGWMPGGGWNGINNVATVIPHASGGGGGPVVHGPHPPGHPPLPHTPAMIAVGDKPLPRSGVVMGRSSFQFAKDSAGFGVPRGSLGNLRGFSNTTVAHGGATMPVHTTAGGSIQRGSAPAYSPSWSPSGSPGANMGSGGGSSMGAGGGMRSGGAPAASAPSAPSVGAVHK